MTKPNFENILSLITEKVSKAEYSINIAVAWFTNQSLFNLLLKKLGEGVDVRLVLRDDHINNSTESLRWIDFIANGGKIHFSKSNKKLHHKYCVIDNTSVISGSYNWTYQAEYFNHENVIFSNEQNVVEAFKVNFEQLIAKSLLIRDSSLLNFRHYAEAPDDERKYIDLESEANLPKSLENKEIALSIARSLYNKKRYDEAIAQTDRILSDIGEEATAYDIKGWALFRKGLYDEAILASERGISLDNSNPEFYNLLGLSHLLINTPFKAVEYFNKVNNLVPVNTGGYMNKILALEKAGRDNEAKVEKLELMKHAKTIALNVKNEYSEHLIMKAILNAGQVKTFSSERIKAGNKAKAIYENLPDEEKDLHDLEEINGLLIN